MKYSSIIIICFVLTPTVLTAQQFEMQTKRPLVNQLAGIELKAGGKLENYPSYIRYSVSKNYFPGADKYNLDNPQMWLRAAPLKMQVEYYYSLPDSIVRLTEYTLNNADTSLLKTVFNNNTVRLTAELGKPAEETKEEHEDWWQKNVIWDNNGIYVKQFMVIGSGTYRVRVLISWK